jgi:hypothetical protein
MRLKYVSWPNYIVEICKEQLLPAVHLSIRNFERCYRGEKGLNYMWFYVHIDLNKRKDINNSKRNAKVKLCSKV